jgi:hypothetical protein
MITNGITNKNTKSPAIVKCPTLCEGQIALDKVPSKYTRNFLVMLSLKEKKLINP